MQFLLKSWIVIFENHFNLHFLAPLWFDYMCLLSFFWRRAYFPALPHSEFRLHGLLLHVHSHTYFTYNYNFFRPFTEFHAKLNKRCRNALYFMTCFLHLKILNIFRENSSKILNMFKNIIKFYRLVKYFSDVIRRVYFLFNFVKKRDYLFNSFLTFIEPVHELFDHPSCVHVHVTISLSDISKVSSDLSFFYFMLLLKYWPFKFISINVWNFVLLYDASCNENKLPVMLQKLIQEGDWNSDKVGRNLREGSDRV